MKYNDKRGKQTIYTINQLGFGYGLGNTEANYVLSEKRSASVSNYLAEKVNSKIRMTAPSFGEQQLKEKLFSDDARAKNRRVEIKIFK